MSRPPADAAAPRIGRAATAALCVGLVAVVFALYFRTLDNPLVFDDRPLMNPQLLEQYARSMFMLDLRWFAYVTLGWTHALAGDALFWFRLTNLALHSATCIALFLLLRALFEQLPLTVKPVPGRLPGMSDWSDDAACCYAFAGALLFAVHPVAVYGVAYLVQRSIVMATLFSILSLLFFLRGVVSGRAAWHVAAALCYFVAVFSKEHAVMLPAVAVTLALLVDGSGGARQPAAVPARRRSAADIVRLLRTLWLPIVLYAAIAALIVARSRGVLGSPYEPFVLEMLGEIDSARPQLAIDNVYPLSVITQAWLWFGYLATWLLPNPGWMSIDLRPAFARSLVDFPQVLGVVLWAGYGLLATWLLLARARWRLLGWAMLAPWLLFATELSTVRLQEPMVLYRSYLWMFALPAALPLLGHLLQTRIAVALLAGAALVLCVPTLNRLATFETPFALWDDAVNKLSQPWQPGAERPFIVRGLEQLRINRPAEALADFQRAIAIAPAEYTAPLNAGVASMRLNQPEQALAFYAQAAELRPASAEPLANAAAALLARGDPAGAAAAAGKATAIDPENALAWTNLALSQLQLGQVDAARTAIERSLALRPGNAEAYAARAMVSIAAQDPERALADFDRAIAASPRSASSHYNRGTLHAQLGNLDAAVRDWSRALELDPGARDALLNRSTAYFMQDQPERAIADLNRLVSLDPGNPQALAARARGLAQAGLLPAALADTEAALKIDAKNGDAWMLRGLLLAELKRPADAAESFRNACRLGVRDGCGR